MNTYIKTMRDAINNYYSIAKKTLEKCENARKTYKADIAADEIKKYEAEREAKKLDAIDIVNEARDKGIADANRWGALDGGKIDDGDIKLLKYDLSNEQFEQLVERHKNNGTMCFILSQYAEKHTPSSAAVGAFGAMSTYNTKIIPTVENKIKAYNEFAKRAIGIIENMSGYGWGQGVNGLGVESSVNSFGSPSPANYELLEALEG